MGSTGEAEKGPPADPLPDYSLPVLITHLGHLYTRPCPSGPSFFLHSFSVLFFLPAACPPSKSNYWASATRRARWSWTFPDPHPLHEPTAKCYNYAESWHDIICVLWVCQCLRLGCTFFPSQSTKVSQGMAYNSPLPWSLPWFPRSKLHLPVFTFLSHVAGIILFYFFWWICVHKTLLNHIYLGPNFSGFDFTTVHVPNFLSDVQSFEI